MAYAGTVVTSGRGRGYVASTGQQTELGGIATHVREQEETATPLQVRLARFARLIGVAVLVAAVLTLAVGMASGEGLADMFLVAVAMAVSVIPEGLPVAFTITLALGVRRMARKNAIIRRLPVVQALGSTTTICTDKIGTLTENRMTVRRIWAGGRTFAVGGEGGAARRGEDIPADTVALAEHHAGRAGGIPLQLRDGLGGFLVDSIEACAERTVWLLQHREEAVEIAAKGRRARPRAIPADAAHYGRAAALCRPARRRYRETGPCGAGGSRRRGAGPGLRDAPEAGEGVACPAPRTDLPLLLRGLPSAVHAGAGPVRPDGDRGPLTGPAPGGVRSGTGRRQREGLPRQGNPED